MLNSPFFKENNSFVFGGSQHLWSLVFCFLFGVILIYVSKKYATKKQQNTIGNIFAIALSLSVVFAIILKIGLNEFDIKNDLPFHLCSLIALLLPIYSITRKKGIYEVILFWILAGTLQSIITPDVVHGFPHYSYIKYWFTHAGLIVFIFYATFIYNSRPSLKSVFKSFLVLQVYLVFIFFINRIFNSNYFYINGKPEVTTLLDSFGEWPYYILVGELVIIPFFLLIYLPFYISKRKYNLFSKELRLIFKSFKF